MRLPKRRQQSSVEPVASNVLTGEHAHVETAAQTLQDGLPAVDCRACRRWRSLVVAADWPSFKPGQWQLERTMESAGKTPEKVSLSECFDPSAEQAKQRAMLSKAGCQFSPLEQNGTTYRYSANCKMGGMSSTSVSVLEVRSTEAYTIVIDSVMGSTKTHEVVTARRLGDCPK